MHFSPPMYTTHALLFHTPLHDHPTNAWWGVQIMELLIMQFSLPSCYFPILSPNNYLGTLFSNTLSQDVNVI